MKSICDATDPVRIMSSKYLDQRVISDWMSRGSTPRSHALEFIKWPIDDVVWRQLSVHISNVIDPDGPIWR